MELNKQIYRLDHHVKETCSQDKFEFCSVPSASPAVAALPHFPMNGSAAVFEHLRGSNGSAGGSLMALGGKVTGGSNGFSHYHSHAAHHCLPQLLLPEALLSAKLQVKDLLSPSPVGRSLFYIDEANSTAARTRYAWRSTVVIPFHRMMYAHVGH